MNIVNNAEIRKFEAYDADGVRAGWLQYEEDAEGDLHATHTWTEQAFRGRGVAGEMLDALVDYASGRGVHIVPVCSYVVAAFKKHPDKYRRVMKPEA